MKFKVWYFNPQLEAFKKGWGETNVVFFAKNANQALHQFRDEFPDWECKVSRIEEMSSFHYCDNVLLRGDGKKNNYAMDKSDPQFEEYFAFDGIVYHASAVVTWEADNAFLVWNGKFNW